jgi:hypothetical protein
VVRSRPRWRAMRGAVQPWAARRSAWARRRTLKGTTGLRSTAPQAQQSGQGLQDPSLVPGGELAQPAPHQAVVQGKKLEAHLGGGGQSRRLQVGDGTVQGPGGMVGGGANS